MKVFIAQAHTGPKSFTGWSVLAPVRISEEECRTRLRNWVTRLCASESEKPIEVGEY